QDGLRDPRQLVAADREGGELRGRRQHVHHRLEQAGIRGSAVGDALAQLVERRIVQEALLVHDVGEPQVAGVEDLQLRLHAQLADARGTGPHHVRGRDVDAGALAEVEGAAVQGAYLRAQGLDVREALRLVDEIRAVDGDRGRLRV